MSDGTATVVGDVLRVLVAGDADAIDVAMDALSSQFESISLVRERSLEPALERLGRLEVHCVVCPFPSERASADGSLLEGLRDRDADVPIVAALDARTVDGDADSGSDSGSGSSPGSGPDPAAAALEAGATDVVDVTDPRAVIARRVKNTAERYRLETATDRRSRSILERSDALVWVVDAEGAIEYASAAVERRLGYTPDELERTSLSRLVHPEDGERADETLETVAAAAFGATERVDVRLGHGDGSWHAYDLTATNRLADPVVEGIVLTLSTASADAEGRPALERLAEPILALGPQWELRSANAAAARLFEGETPDPGTVVWDRLEESIRNRLYERAHEAAATGETVTFEIDLGGGDTGAEDDGETEREERLTVAVHPGEDGVTVHARESTTTADRDRDRVQDRDRLAVLESAIDALEDGVVVLEGSTVRLVNRALLDLTGESTLVGRDLEAVFDDELAAAVRERAASPVVRWMDPLTGTLAGGDDRAVDVSVAPLSDGERTLCVVRDRQRSATGTLETIERAVATIRNAETRPAVRRGAVDAALEIPTVDLAAWYLLEEDVLRPAAAETAAASAGGRESVELPPIDREGLELLERLEIEAPDEPDRSERAGEDGGGDAAAGDRDRPRDGDAVVFDRSDVEPLLERAGIRAERIAVVPAGDHGFLLATSPEPMAFGARERTPLEVVVRAAATALDAVERDATARSYRGELDRLEAVVDRCRRLRESERTLLAGDGREAIARRLCESVLSLSDPGAAGTIELAWVGDVTAGTERIAVDAWAGRDGEFLEEATIEAVDDADHPAARAAETLEPVFVPDIGADDPGSDGDLDRDRDRNRDQDSQWRHKVLDRGFRSVLSVPLVADGFCYGTLTVYADDPSALDADTRAACDHLATVAAHAVAAVERKRALLSERVTELEVVVPADGDPLSAVAHGLDRRLDVQAVVPRSTAGSTVFGTVPTVDEEDLEAAVDSLSTVESARIVGERADASLLELVCPESTVAEALADHGGVLRSVTPVDGRTRLVIDLSSTVDVRSFVRMLERRHPGARLAARRERDRSTEPMRAFDAELRRQLSERQLRTIETAYYSGFFEWPRESTGEAVADSLGVSQPTFSRHLRIAQRKLFELLFEERDGHVEP